LPSSTEYRLPRVGIDGGIQTKREGVRSGKQKDVTMIAVIFEVWPKPPRKQDHLNVAADLKPLLEKVDGFISVERFESLYEPGKILSLSFFRDEAAVKAWRNTIEHRKAQAQGRHEIFANYRLRVASVVRDYGMNEREQVPGDSREVHKA
jgi:heme-degrading monooxygenase HmoA